MKILVVGGSGFIGRALIEALARKGHEVESWDRIAGPSVGETRFRPVDLLGEAPLPSPEGPPWEAAFHLAAYSVPGMSWSTDLVLANLRMTARVLDHLAQTAAGCRTIYASSAFVYQPSPRLLTEEAPTGSGHPYALSKLLGESWALSLADRLDIRIVRPFNLIGPGMAKGLLVPDLLERIRSGDTRLAMRGRDDVRDFLDWRDAVEAYCRMATAPAPSGTVWNLCSGRPTAVSSLVAALLRAHGRDLPVSFAEPPAIPMVGSPERLMDATGWQPRRSLEETAADLVADRSGGTVPQPPPHG